MEVLPEPKYIINTTEKSQKPKQTPMIILGESLSFC